jgi:hypothetical protein
MIIRVVLALLIVAFSWSQVAAHDDYDDYYDDHHHHHDNDDDWEDTYLYVGIGVAVVAGLTVLGAILFHQPRPPQLLEDTQKTPSKIRLEGCPTGIRIRF